MLIKMRVKSIDKIQETLGENNTHRSGAYFNPDMGELCGDIIEVFKADYGTYRYTTPRWNWHKDWLESSKRIVCGGE